MLESDRFEEEVRKDQARARQMGIRGVPFFVLDGRLAVSGAQASEVFRGAFRQLEEERGPGRGDG
jgi:predicted DsbA family dithiol-disulfide isomerase